MLPCNAPTLRCQPLPAPPTVVKKSPPYAASPIRILVLAGLCAGLLFLLPVAIGVRGVAVNHSLARVRIQAVKPGVDQEQVRDAIRAMEGFHDCRVALESILATNAWRAEIEFEAGSMTEAAVRLFKWRKQLKLPVHVTAEKLTYQSLRLRRPDRGDIVFGVPQILLRDDLNDSLDESPRSEW